MFKRVLIANRGEIACRIIRTARAMGIETVAVYSDADKHSLAVEMADISINIGPPPAQDSYLNIDNIIAAANDTGADCIHPGYGFLSENATFAQACEAANITFIGPPINAINTMGSKAEAKQLMEQAGVSLVPGYHGDDQSDKILAAEANNIGYPVLLKAAMGGGGKGMRIVTSEDGFLSQLESAKREARSSFNDDRMIIEKYIPNPRHIEIQVFADSNGNCVHLFERECSIQRRHQKIIEEAPAPGMTDELRQQMGEAAVAAAIAIGYVGAGTVEFIVDSNNNYYFIEMNTRLQVEHPVTEMVTGQDLVQWQFEVAAGEPLPCQQQDLSITGHAIEARIYAEDPYNDFLPVTGKVLYLDHPQQDEHLRIDTGIRVGDSISPFYDPMIAKLIVWDNSRDQAVSRLQHSLWQYQLVGTTTNTTFLAQISHHPRFVAGVDAPTIIPDVIDTLNQQGDDNRELALNLAAVFILLQQNIFNATHASLNNDPYSPWAQDNGWRQGQRYRQHLHFIHDHNDDHIEVLYINDDTYQLQYNEHTVTAHNASLDGHRLQVSLNDKHYDVAALQFGNEITVMSQGLHYCVSLHDVTELGSDESSAGKFIAPMPGTVVCVNVKAGDTVRQGDSILVLEAMKMEHTVYAPQDGTVNEVFYQVGDLVEEGVALIDFAANPKD
ncbi:MAG: 3-methylcrotonyl-CoA carboxylase [Legionellales bacterium]|nr:3-methylcrotonyl-CoA carboxylase [Legionellales bacterium]|tara:strand:+ start:10176 stop:12182 length:2007 start_codon:yes stop_codon:yes gene_type:complete